MIVIHLVYIFDERYFKPAGLLNMRYEDKGIYVCNFLKWKSFYLYENFPGVCESKGAIDKKSVLFQAMIRRRTGDKPLLNLCRTCCMTSYGGSWCPFYWHGLTLIPAWISNDNPAIVWDEIIYPFTNFNGCTGNGNA